MNQRIADCLARLLAEVPADGTCHKTADLEASIGFPGAIIASAVRAGRDDGLRMMVKGRGRFVYRERTP